MPFNTNVAPEQSSGIVMDLQGFLTAFAHTYAAGREKELEYARKTIDDTRNNALEEIKGYGQRGFKAIKQSDVDAGMFTPEQIKSFQPAAYAQSQGYYGFYKEEKEQNYKPSTPEQILTAKNTIRDDINKRKQELWSAYPILQSAEKDLNNLSDSDKIYEVLTDKSKWFTKKSVELNEQINQGLVKKEDRDFILTEIKNMVPVIADYKDLEVRYRDAVRRERQPKGGQSVNQTTQITGTIKRSSDMEAAIKGAMAKGYTEEEAQKMAIDAGIR